MKSIEIERAIIVKLQYEGVHRWIDCNLDEVHYLTYPHRHIFFITIEKEVSHNDRDIEIILFKRKVYEYLTKKYNHKFGNRSCEDIAEDILNQFDCKSVEVLEDNENGAKIIKR